jgi:hypothetical protein
MRSGALPPYQGDMSGKRSPEELDARRARRASAAGRGGGEGGGGYQDVMRGSEEVAESWLRWRPRGGAAARGRGKRPPPCLLAALQPGFINSFDYTSQRGRAVLGATGNSLSRYREGPTLQRSMGWVGEPRSLGFMGLAIAEQEGRGQKDNCVPPRPGLPR